MSKDDPNPYQASYVQAFEEPLTEPTVDELTYRDGMEYMQAIKYVFNSPNWIMNLMFGGLCILSTQVIPIIGNVIWWGYQFEIVESLHCRPHRPYPDFTFNRFSEYLNRGLWVLLAMLVMMIAIVPLAIVVALGIAGCFAGMVAATGGGDEAAGVAVLILMPVALTGAIGLALVANVLMTPFVIRAGLCQDFGMTLNFPFAKDFIRKMWKETVVATIFLIVVAVISSFVGLALFCVGVFLTQAYVILVQGHLMLQLYQVYLSRGGEVIPLKSIKPPKSPTSPANPGGMPPAV